ncbi:MAG: hypothetical protein AAF709_06495, partial [Pseudomonadota bacterium]
DEIILIPDVSAPRRRTIGVEILAQLDRVLSTPAAISAKDKKVPQEQLANSTDTQGNNRFADQEGVSPTRQAEQSGQLDRKPLDRRQKSRAAKKVPALAKPGTKKVVTDVTTTSVNRLAATSTVVDLPSQRPAVDSKEEQKAPAKISLGKATGGGELLLSAGAISQRESSTSFAIQTHPKRFERIRMHLAAQNLRVDKLVVYYDDGSRHKESFDVVLQRNTYSRWIPVDPKLAIVKVAVHPVTVTSGKAVARIEVLGEPTLDALLPGAAARSENDGWLLIAAQSGRGIRDFNGQVPVSRNRGGFSKLRLARTGRLPRPAQLALQISDAGSETAELTISKSDIIALPPTQRGPIESVKLSLPASALNRLSNTGIYQLWAKY